jgi:methylenetetrahydrofolate dehydrogenase (NADP+) / methenyltetrahydrofolate cyclohydrolase
VSARVVDGEAVAARVRARVARDVERILDGYGAPPGLATVLLGDDPASAMYVRMKQADCARVGIRSFRHELGADTEQAELAELLQSLGADDRVDGILLQLPLPAALDAGALLAALDPGKDVDGLTPANAGLLAQGRPGLVPCTPAGVMELIAETGVELDGARAVVIGRSILVGRPLAALLLGANATVTQCHSRTRELAGLCREADLLVAAVGSPRLVTADMVRPGAVVIDVGTNRTESGLVGDVDFDSVSARAAAITPVPGGVGPMTRAMLLANTVEAVRRRLELAGRPLAARR